MSGKPSQFTEEQIIEILREEEAGAKAAKRLPDSAYDLPKIPGDVHEAARDRARKLMGKPEFAKSRDERGM